MNRYHLWQRCFLICIFSLMLNGCAHEMSDDQPAPDSTDYAGLPLYRGQAPYSSSFREEKYASIMPPSINTNEKVVVVNPRTYSWAAYNDGRLVKAGIAQAGANFCEDEGQPCRTDTGTFRVYSLGDSTCISHKYPVGKGGSLMPYCMFFNRGQSLHGTPDQMLSEANISHGCVHMRIPDAEWLRYNFVQVGTKVVILPYD